MDKCCICKQNIPQQSNRMKIYCSSACRRAAYQSIQNGLESSYRASRSIKQFVFNYMEGKDSNCIGQNFYDRLLKHYSVDEILKILKCSCGSCY